MSRPIHAQTRRFQPSDVRDHVREQGVARDIERNAEAMSAER